MSQIIYTKYNKLRKKEFRVRTCIYEENGQRWVETSAICSEAEHHAKKMAGQAERLKAVYPGLEFAKAEQTETGVRFEYLTGKTWDNFIAGAAATPEELVRNFEKAFEVILPAKESLMKFEETPEFCAVFGKTANLDNCAAAPLANVDCILENIIVDDGKATCLDYEWVFDFLVPVDFMRYRVVHYFYKAHPEMEKTAAEAEVLTAMNISEGRRSAFVKMEQAFQQYVFGGELDCRYTENYRQPVTTYDQMVATDRQKTHEIEELRKVVDHYEGVERKLRKVGLWQALQGVQKVGRKVKGALRRG